MMDRIFLYIVFFSLAGSVGALLAGALLVILPGTHTRLRTLLLSYAVGALLGASFLGLLPGAAGILGVEQALRVGLVSYLLFFFFEKILRLPHGHGLEYESRRPAAVLVLASDSVHNFIDGILITVTFFVSIPLGVIAAAAVVAHELPQEFGDLIILTEGGFSRKKAITLNLLSSLTTVLGALLAYWNRSFVEPVVPYLLAFSGAGFLYVAATDLSPILQHLSGRRAALVQFVGLLGGVATIFMLQLLDS